MKNHEIIILILVALIIVLIFSGFGNSGDWGMMSGSGWGIMGIFSWLFMTLILVALILFIIWMIKQIQK